MDFKELSKIELETCCVHYFVLAADNNGEVDTNTLDYSIDFLSKIITNCETVFHQKYFTKNPRTHKFM